MPNLVDIGQTVAKISRFNDFQDGGRRRLGFSEMHIFSGLYARETHSASADQISSRSAPSMLRYCVFSVFQDGVHPPSWICWTRVRTTHEQYSSVLTAVQSLVAIGAVVSIICRF